ncbi:MAG TPA: hypothetical protein VJA16_05685, partial [Thermoanaerobaculia bacterium]
MQVHLPRRGTRRRTHGASVARDCRRLREQLCGPAAHAGQGAPAAPTALTGDGASRHLASCPDCAAFARRLELARQALAGPRSAPAIEPDPYFPARVLARIARPSELIGWAAF